MLNVYELANGIVVAACDQYVKAAKNMMRYPNDKEAEDDKADAIRFFGSPWYYQLTNINHVYLVNKLNDRVIDELIRESFAEVLRGKYSTRKLEKILDDIPRRNDYPSIVEDFKHCSRTRSRDFKSVALKYISNDSESGKTA